LAWRVVPRRTGLVPSTAFDWLGAVLLAAVLGGAAALVVEGRHAPAALAAGIPLLVVVAVGFVWLELRHPDPVFQPRFFAIRGFAAANGGVATSNLAFYTVLLATPILLTRHLQWSSLQIGVALALLSAPMVVFSPVGGRLADRLGRRPPAVAGCALLAAGLLPLALAPGLGPSTLLPCLCLMGAGVGLSAAGLQASAIEALAPEQAGVAAGLFSTSRYVGSFAGSIALARLLDRSHGLAGFHAVFLIALCAATVSVLVTLALPSQRPPESAAG
jgi:MFS family permease